MSFGTHPNIQIIQQFSNRDLCVCVIREYATSPCKNSAGWKIEKGFRKALFIKFVYVVILQVFLSKHHYLVHGYIVLLFNSRAYTQTWIKPYIKVDHIHQQKVEPIIQILMVAASICSQLLKFVVVNLDVSIITKHMWSSSHTELLFVWSPNSQWVYVFRPDWYKDRLIPNLMWYQIWCIYTNKISQLILSSLCFAKKKIAMIFLWCLCNTRSAYKTGQEKYAKNYSKYIRTAWNTKVLSTCCQPVTKGHNWHIDYLSVILFCHGWEACTWHLCAPSSWYMFEWYTKCNSL